MQKILFRKVTVRPESEAGKSNVVALTVRKAGKLLSKNLIGARISTGVNKCHVLTLISNAKDERER